MIAMIDSSFDKDGNSTGEFDLISRLTEFSAAGNSKNRTSVLTGIGDDTAVVSTPSGQLLLTTDAIVDGIHFTSADERWYDIGWKCAVSNLSDIAAMGGVPDHALVTLGVPQGVSEETYADFYAGMNEAFEKFGGIIVGGDVVSSPTMFVNLALTGHPGLNSGGDPAWLLRSAAQIGDLLCVSGPLGGSAGGLEVLLSGDTNPSGQILINRHFRPTPRIELGNLLVGSGIKCAMDVSDGLIGDAEKIAMASSVGITIEMSEIPLPAELIFMFGTSAIDLAMSGGEDYELIFTAPETIIKQLQQVDAASVCVIGRVTDGDTHGRRVSIVDAAGENYEPIRKGWDHLNG